MTRGVVVCASAAQDWDNSAALRLYQKKGYVCELIDPPIRIKRCCYLRKRLSEDAPESDEDMLSFDGLAPLFDEQAGSVAELSFTERHFGVLAPAVGVIGGLVGVIFF